MDYVIIILVIVAIVMLGVLVKRQQNSSTEDVSQLKEKLSLLEQRLSDINSNTSENIKVMGDMLRNSQRDQYNVLESSVTKELNGFRDMMSNSISNLEKTTALSIENLEKNTRDTVENFGKNTNERMELINKSADSARTDTKNRISELANMQEKGFRDFSEKTGRDFENIRQSVGTSLDNIRKENNEKLDKMQDAVDKKLDRIQNLVDTKLMTIQGDMDKKLDKMQGIVDEKLEKTLNERITSSFNAVNERLATLHTSLGEMKKLSSDVGNLNRVLSNVKTRGILGEYQLGAILEEILSPTQYEENVAVVKNSDNRVEFAVKMPGRDNSFVYLPIDSKFPGDTYEALLNAYDSGVKENTDSCAKALKRRLLDEAKDISEKYICPPYTTNFAIMFLPFEGLYAEAVRMGVIEEMQRRYRVNVAGPSTMAALLNSLQMGFRTMEIQKRTSEVWKVLTDVKTEFEKYTKALEDTQKYFKKADEGLNKLVTTRTNVMLRKLDKIETIEEKEEV